jgi:hypothetical protein
VKIFNIKTNVELFSLKIQANRPSPSESVANLSKLCYTLDYIITIDSNSMCYFIDLKQQTETNQSKQDNHVSSSSSSFLAHQIKLGATSSLNAISLHENGIISVGDSDGVLYLLSFNEF